MRERAGKPQLVDDPRFADNPARVVNRDVLDAEIAEVFARLTQGSRSRPAGSCRRSPGAGSRVWPSWRSTPRLRRIDVEVAGGRFRGRGPALHPELVPGRCRPRPAHSGRSAGSCSSSERRRHWIPSLRPGSAVARPRAMSSPRPWWMALHAMLDHERGAHGRGCCRASGHSLALRDAEGPRAAISDPTAIRIAACCCRRSICRGACGRAASSISTRRCRVGDHIERRSTIAAITPKTGSSGPLVFVEVGPRLADGERR